LSALPSSAANSDAYQGPGTETTHEQHARMDAHEGSQSKTHHWPTIVRQRPANAQAGRGERPLPLARARPPGRLLSPPAHPGQGRVPLRVERPQTAFVHWELEPDVKHDRFRSEIVLQTIGAGPSRREDNAIPNPGEVYRARGSSRDSQRCRSKGAEPFISPMWHPGAGTNGQFCLYPSFGRILRVRPARRPAHGGCDKHNKA